MIHQSLLNRLTIEGNHCNKSGYKNTKTGYNRISQDREHHSLYGIYISFILLQKKIEPIHIYDIQHHRKYDVHHVLPPDIFENQFKSLLIGKIPICIKPKEDYVPNNKTPKELL